MTVTYPKTRTTALEQEEFAVRNRGGFRWRGGGEELGGVKGGETIIKIYYVRGLKSVFSWGGGDGGVPYH